MRGFFILQKIANRALAGPLLAVGRVLSNLITYGSGTAGGIFAPSLASGAALGSMASQLFPWLDSQMLVLVGMAAFLAGVTQAPITSSVLVLEMTDGHRAIFSILLASLFAQGAARWIQPESFYELVARRYYPEKASVDDRGGSG